MENGKDEIIKKYYKDLADQNGISPFTTSPDEIMRKKEIELIRKFFLMIKGNGLRVLDLGCGNGYTISFLRETSHENAYFGLDFSEELIDIAKKRQLSGCEFLEGDARRLPYNENFFDVVFTERTLINILDWEGQKTALKEIQKVLKPGGYYFMMEGFSDGWENNNKARKECGLPELKVSFHNKYFEKVAFLEFIKDMFAVVEPIEFGVQWEKSFPQNFLSSHYFIARVLHALVTKGGDLMNTEFVNFFSFLPPIGNYSPIQLYILKNKKNA